MMTRTLANWQVPAIGLGCMNLSHAYGVPPDAAQGIDILHRALEVGYTVFDTAALYGFGANETLVGKALRAHRDRIVLCSKGGMAGVTFPDGIKRVIDGRPETLRQNCEDSLRRLGVEAIDLYYLHRWDKSVPVEDSVGALSDLVRAGKIQTIGLSEVSASTLRKAHAVHPIAAVQTEYSLWTRNPEIGVLDACRELGATFVAFSPVARGFLGGEVRDVGALVNNDIRRMMPRFAPDHYERNLQLLGPFQEIADAVGCTPAQLSLAWLLHKEPELIAIPGTSKMQHMVDNFASQSVVLTDEQMQKLDRLINQKTVSGARYSALNAKEVDTEDF
jgi:aryl-alcohol dehydrogenase-like predicted oxidoreductase